MTTLKSIEKVRRLIKRLNIKLSEEEVFDHATDLDSGLPLSEVEEYIKAAYLAPEEASANVERKFDLTLFTGRLSTLQLEGHSFTDTGILSRYIGDVWRIDCGTYYLTFSKVSRIDSSEPTIKIYLNL